MMRKALYALAFIAAVCLVTTVKDAAVIKYYTWDAQRQELKALRQWDAAIADTITGNSAYLSFDGTSICATPPVGLCATVSNAQTWSATGTFSNAAPVAYSNASGTTTVASSTTGTTTYTTVAGSGIYGNTFAAPSGTTPAGTISIGGAAPINFANTSAPTTISFPTVAGTTNATAALLFSDTDAVTCVTADATHVAYDFVNGSAFSLLSIGCGTSGVTIGKQLTVSGNVTGQVNLIASSSSNAQGELALGGTNVIAGALGNGAINFNGTGSLDTQTACAGNTSAKAFTMTNGISCKITVVAADVAGPIAVAYPNTFNTAPDCITSLGVWTNAVTIKCVDNGSKTGATVTFSGNVATSDSFYILLSGGK